ncbi:MAG: hypothetical protein QOJ68_2576 [Blastococcus sp.]|nr:hypothetical protein [Blastococcus sp.]
MAPGGLAAQPDGPDRWLLVETGRPANEAVIGVITGRSGEGFTLAPAEDDTESAPPAGPYGSLDDAVGACETWRLARFEGRRP